MHGDRHGNALVLMFKTRPNENAASQSPGLPPFKHSNKNGVWPLVDFGAA
jgi:hypothetical protein